MHPPLPTRRYFLGVLALALSGDALSQPRRIGRLVVAGGAEDRLKDPVILHRFVELCGGPTAQILVLTAASVDQAASWQGYKPVFEALGAVNFSALPIYSREEANSSEVVNRILNADGIFMTGGDQRRLVERLWETSAARAMHTAYHLRGCTIGGTSAGAAAMSRHMLAEGDTPPLPEKYAATLDSGLGFVPSAIIDPHFSERRRLGRLLSVLAQRPQMLGVGVDEDTALVIERGQGVEIVGQGAVTLIDSRRMRSNFDDIAASERLEMLGMQLHVLLAGHRYDLEERPRTKSRSLPGSLREAIATLVAPGPIRG